LIKSIGIKALTKSVEDLKALVRLLESLGLHKDLQGGKDGYHYAEYIPEYLHLDVTYGTRPGNNPDIFLRVSHPDTAFEVVKRLGLKLLGDFSPPKMPDALKFFDVELPGGTLVRIGGSRLPLLTDPKPVPDIQGHLNATGKRFCLVVSTFNSFITERLLAGAVDVLIRSGAEQQMIVRVPGAFEIPSAARTLAETKTYDAIICIGCLLRGDTAHYDVIVNEVTRGIGQSAQETGVPHAFGVLTCETLEQAIDRAGLKMGNKGAEAALAAIEMANLNKFVAINLSSADVGKKPARGRFSSVAHKGKNKGKSRKPKR
jgi:6,7-dimethyl-8-ribityllumazine synthase